DHNGQTEDVSSLVARQQRQRQKRDDVDDCSEKNRVPQPVRSEPRRDLSRLMASEATTGSSTSIPNAMMSAAMEIWCNGIPASAMPPNVIATVSGIAVATTNAERQSIRNKATSTTTTTASMKQRMK